MHLVMCQLLSGAAGAGNGGAEQPRTVFHRALEAVTLTWDDTHLQEILRGDVSSSGVCHGCHGNRGMYRHGDGAGSYVCMQHDVAGRLIWTGTLSAILEFVGCNECLYLPQSSETGKKTDYVTIQKLIVKNWLLTEIYGVLHTSGPKSVKASSGSK